MRTTLICTFVTLLFLATNLFAQDRTVIRDQRAKQMLLGKHMISLQWISWDHLGRATVTDKKGSYLLVGEQKGVENTDFLKINGRITSIDAKQFELDGTIETQVSHINGGKQCVRTGKFTFRITGKRKYWRMQQIDNPCDEAADYVDIYIR